MKGILAGFMVLLAIGMAWGQAPMEPSESSSVQSLVNTVVNFASADTTMFALVGTGKVQRSGVMNAWKYTAMLYKVSGSAPNVKLRFWSGWCDRLPGENKADTTTYHFAVFDSVTVTAAGEYQRQISDEMVAAPYWYLELITQSGNGNDTVIGPCKAVRDRY